MKSTYNIVWSKRASHNLDLIITYLEQNWTEKEVKKFAQKLERCIHILEKNPAAFPETKNRPGLRRVVITKQNTLFYKIEEECVKLVNIFDTRQNPGKN